MATTLILQCSCDDPDCEMEFVIGGHCIRIIEKTDGIGERVIFTDDDFELKKFLSKTKKAKKTSRSNLETSEPGPPNMPKLKII